MIQSSALPVLCSRVSDAKLAHPSSVGFLAVRGDLSLQGDRRPAVQGDAFGGLLVKRPRSTQFDVRIQLTNGAYGISGSAAQGSPTTEATAPAGVTARGVPPRGRPV